MDGGRPLLVIGHKNPDTDSICSAIAYARYKREVLGEEAEPCRAGNINAQTRYALERFGAPDPRLVADVLPRIADIMIGRDALLLASPDQPLRDAYEIIVENRFSFLPVVDDAGRCVGRITALGLAGLLGRVSGDGAPGVDALLEAPIRGELEPTGPTFPAATTIRDAEVRVNRSNEGGFIVTDETGAVAGVVTRMNFMTDSRFRLALVDHNELSQSVEGVEHAAVEEIIDHHRIGVHRTTEPITVINRVVGSTCTIVADLFRQSSTEPSAETSGLLLSGVLSDTVILTSPTATALDRSIASWLAERAGVGVEEYGRALFAAGSEIGAQSGRDIVSQDQKFYEERGRRFAVSQVEMVGFESFWSRADELREVLDGVRSAHGLSCAALMVTDITTSTTLLLFRGPDALRDRIAYPRVAESVYEMRGVVSRKKQVLPTLLEIV